MIKKEYSLLFVFSLFVLHFGVIFFIINNMSLSYKEVLIFTDSKDRLLHFLANLWIGVFGKNDLSVKLSFVLLHFINLILFIKISLYYFKQSKDVLLLLFIYTFMLGSFSSAIIINDAVVNQFGILLFLYFFHIKPTFSFFLLPFLLFLDNSFAILFLSLSFFAFFSNKKLSAVFAFLLFIISMNLFGFDIHHRPQSHFLNTISAYSFIFSPIIFIFLVAILFKHFSKNRNIPKNILWYFSTTALLFSLMLSFRQKIYIDDFAPYIVLAFVLIVKEFLFSLRVKLVEFRAKNYIFLSIVSLYLVFAFIFTVWHSHFYPLAQKMQMQVFERNYIAKDLAIKLKDMGISGVKTDKQMQSRLNFYGISEDSLYLLSSNKSSNAKHIQIKYNNFIKDFYLVFKKDT